MWATFATKAQQQHCMEFEHKFFFTFSDSSKPSQSVSLIYELAWLAGIGKSCSKLHIRLLLWPKLPTYFDDVMTMENNQQVRVNIDATLVAIFRIGGRKRITAIPDMEVQLSSYNFNSKFKHEKSQDQSSRSTRCIDETQPLQIKPI